MAGLSFFSFYMAISALQLFVIRHNNGEPSEHQKRAEGLLDTSISNAFSSRGYSRQRGRQNQNMLYTKSPAHDRA